MGIKAKTIGERVLIEPAAAEEKTAAGIIIPDTAKEKAEKRNCNCNLEAETTNSLLKMVTHGFIWSI